MKIKSKLMTAAAMVSLLFLILAIPAQAYDERSGETVVIKADEVIEDDLYVSAGKFTLDGTIQGDLVVTGGIITINGTVEGDLIAAGESIIINGTVMDDARIAGAALQVGEKGKVGSDFIAAGASIETKKGSEIGGDVVASAAQVLLAGDNAGNATINAAAFELRGEIGGDVNAEVGDAGEDNETPPIGMYISMFTQETQSVIPAVKPGLTIGEGAKIKGAFEYTQTKDINIPANAVGGKITRSEPVVDIEIEPTPAEAATAWALNLLHTIVTLLIIGSLMGWLAPAFMATLIEKTRAKPAASFGWGFVSLASFFFAILIIFIVMIIGSIFFGTLMLGSIVGLIIWTGILLLFALTLGFSFAGFYLTHIIIARIVGNSLISRIAPAKTEHKFIPLAVGVVILALLTSIPYIGWMFSMVIIFTGLGAMWVWGSEMRRGGKSAQ